MKSVSELTIDAFGHATKAENDLVRTFILVATILIPLTTPVFFNLDIFGIMELYQKTIFSLGWFFILVSLISGLIFVVVIHGFYSSTADTMQRLRKDLELKENKDNAKISAKMKEANEKMPVKSIIWPMRIQVICLFLGLFLLAISIILSIF